MQIFFVRHGETDWQALETRGVRGWARSFAPLTPIGRVQIDTIARDYRLAEAEAILCSSYARALESAALLNRKLNKPLYVEYDLHEWLPQKDPLADVDAATIAKATEEFTYYTGYTPPHDNQQRGGSSHAGPAHRHAHRPPPPPPPEARSWESIEEVRSRVLSALQRYTHLNNVIVVSHAVVIASIVGVQRMIQHAEIVPFQLDFATLESDANTASPSAVPVPKSKSRMP